MENPISKRARSVIYLIGVVVAALTAPAAALLGYLEMNDLTPVLLAVTGAVSLIVGILARANLDTTAVNPEQLKALLELDRALAEELEKGPATGKRVAVKN